MSTIVIAGFGTQKNPGFFGETRYGAGSTSGGTAPLIVLLVGLMGVGGTMIPNGAPVQILSDDQADTLCAPGSELACMAYGTNRVPGATVFACSPAQPASGAAATATLTITGTWTATGTFRYRINGEQRAVPLTAGMTPTTASAAIAADVMSRTRWPVTAANALGVTTFTHRNLSTSGNFQRIQMDLSDAPAGFAATLTSATGGTLTNTSGGIFMDGGAGAPDLTTLLGVISPYAFDRIALAAQDSTALDAVQAVVDAAAGPTVGFLEHVVTASNRASSVAQGITRTTLNDQRFQHVWALNQPSHPAVIAATVAAQRASFELQSPITNYDDMALPGIAAQDPADAPSFATITAALDNGVTPLRTSPDGVTRIVRAITTRCLTSGGSPDYSCLDVSTAWVPDFARRGLRANWESTFQKNNTSVGPDDPTGKAPPAGLATPSVWNATVTGYLRGLERGDNLPGPILIDVDNHLPVSVYDKDNRRIMSAVPVVDAPVQHQIGVSVRSAA